LNLFLLFYSSTDLLSSPSSILCTDSSAPYCHLRSVRPQSELIPTASTMYLQARFTFILSTLAIFSSFADVNAVALSERSFVKCTNCNVTGPMQQLACVKTCGTNCCDTPPPPPNSFDVEKYCADKPASLCCNVGQEACDTVLSGPVCCEPGLVCRSLPFPRLGNVCGMPVKTAAECQEEGSPRPCQQVSDCIGFNGAQCTRGCCFSLT